MINLIKKTIFSLYIALAFLTPLIFSNNTAELYEFPKMFFVYLVGTSIFFLYFLLIVVKEKRDFQRPPLPIITYLIFTALSFVFSTHGYTSLWGYYSRFNGGLVSFLIFFGLYFVALNFLDQKRKETLKDAFCLGLAPVALYGLFQISESVRVFSTLGQPNWLAAYLVFLLPLLLERILHSEILLKKTFWIFVFVISVVSLLFTRSLSGLLGFGVSFVYLALYFRKKLLNRWTPLFVILLSILLFINFDFLSSRLNDAIIFSKNPQDYTVSDPGLIRLGLWQGSIKMATSDGVRFLLGYGPETFAYQFPFYRPGILNYSSEWNYILNKPHNYYLEILVESGILALLSYLVIVVYTLKQKNFYLAAGFVSFYVSNIFSWPTVTTSLIFWIWLAFIEIKKNRSP
jgi:O-antigen ligase